MKGGLHLDAPTGERWELALGLIADGREAVYLGDRIQIQRWTGWPEADERIHIAILNDRAGTQSEQTLTEELRQATRRIGQIAEADARFAKLLNTYGVVWEYVGDDGSATWKIADVSREGHILGGPF